MSFRKYLVLAAIVLFGSSGDICLSYAMKKAGPLSATDIARLISFVFTPWVAIGIVLLIGFFASYMAALSWADLTYVLPAASLGYVMLALMAQFLLHEQVTLTRWLGILLVSGGVAVVTRGPSLTPAQPETEEGD
ncbi:MAG: EamA family transporter [Acidobacteriia bacterium]|nr:EamA family transporter [Terriglobia bacterium]